MDARVQLEAAEAAIKVPAFLVVCPAPMARGRMEELLLFRITHIGLVFMFLWQLLRAQAQCLRMPAAPCFTAHFSLVPAAVPGGSGGGAPARRE